VVPQFSQLILVATAYHSVAYAGKGGYNNCMVTDAELEFLKQQVQSLTSRVHELEEMMPSIANTLQHMMTCINALNKRVGEAELDADIAQFEEDCRNFRP
jgi:hypothetical protein